MILGYCGCRSRIAVGIGAKDTRQVDAQIIGVDVIHTKLEVMVAACPLNRIAHLPATLVGECGPVIEGWGAEAESILNSNSRWNSIGVRVSRRLEKSAFLLRGR